MGIFIKRPLCLFCFSFILASVVGCIFGGRYNLPLLCLAIFVAAVAFGLSFAINKRRYGLIEAAIALLFAAVALASSYFFITIPTNNARSFEGKEKTVRFLVLHEEYVSRYSSKYSGKLVDVGGERADLDAELICSYEGEYQIGDVVYTLADIEEFSSEHNSGIFIIPQDVYLQVVPVVEREQAIITRADGYALPLVCARLREYVSRVFNARLGFDEASLAAGLLTGDKSDIDTEVIRNFRRAGISHVLAVSGLHLSLIIGAAELVLRKCYVKKGTRCIILTFLSFMLLLIAGFSGSASRSVIMLLCAYLCYMLSREADALTSLGVAGALIILISPRSVGDIGFWLSFFATFGLVTWLPLLAEMLRIKKGSDGVFARLLRSVAGKVTIALATTFCATVSILFLSWLFFGEMSVIGLVSNIVVTPLCELYLILSIIIFIFGFIPYFSSVLALVASLLHSAIVSLTSLFSSFEFSVVSLRYDFAAIIIILMSALLALFLIVNIKRKRIILTVPILGIISFCVCLSIFNVMNDGLRASYISASSRDSLVLTEKNSSVMIDISDGTYSPFYSSAGAARENYATEIGAVVLTHYHTKHISSLDNFCRSELVRKIYLPLPNNENEQLVAGDIAKGARDNGVDIIIYEYGDTLRLTEKTAVIVREPDKCSYSSKKIINCSVIFEDKLICYADSSFEFGGQAEEMSRLINMCDVALLGAHGPERKGKSEGLEKIAYPALLAIGSRDKEEITADFIIN